MAEISFALEKACAIMRVSLRGLLTCVGTVVRRHEDD